MCEYKNITQNKLNWNNLKGYDVSWVQSCIGHFCSEDVRHDSCGTTPRADGDIWVGLQDVSSTSQQQIPL
jgi:hypothetical protein